MPNEERSVNFATVCFKRIASPDERAGVEAAFGERAGTVAWRTSARAGRTYGLASLPAESRASDVARAQQATVYDTAIIALALFPTVPEALPSVLEALGGPGRPAGVISCEACDGGAIVEWDPNETAAAAIIGVVDAELGRFRSGRTAELLAPLPPNVVTGIAAEALQTPELGADRELETLLERAGLGRA